MPGWQKFYAAHHEKINLVSIATDAQGTDVVKPWCEKAKSEFTTLVDRKNTLGQMLNLRAVPYGILVDEAGRIVKEPFNIDVKDTETIDLLNKWIDDPRYNEALINQLESIIGNKDSTTSQTYKLFQTGISLLDNGKRDEAISTWRKALHLDPQNWIIRKQIWAVKNPDKFYQANVDYQWQKQQLQSGN